MMISFAAALAFNSVILLYMYISFLKRINKLNTNFNEMHRDKMYSIETLNQELKVELLHLQAMIIQTPKEHKEEFKPQEPKKTSRKRPTEKEKLALSRREAMSKRMKEWWAEDRRRAATESEPGVDKITQ